MVILSVDPGLLVAGFSILSVEGGKVILLDCGVVKMSSGQSLSARLGRLHSFFISKIEEWKITDLALETPFLGKNAQNFMKLGYVRGILLLLVDKYSLILHELAPREVKQGLTGFGGASKDQVARMVMRFFPQLSGGKFDLTDSLALGLCVVWRSVSAVGSPGWGRLLSLVGAL
jgi:crossover junction endodeoxyribonuclease RuvC